MDAPQWKRLEELFASATQLPPDEREAFLDRACVDDPDLRTRIEKLLRHADVGEETIREAIRRTAESVGGERFAVGDRIGPYRLTRKIGEGGMGLVYEADQQSPVRRRVALKVIRLGMDTEEVIARFESERQALALMDHPAIARVFDAGATDRGRPYFVMEYVPGQSITEYCDRERSSTLQRLRLFQRVCEGVQHAHQKGVIHRDLKPSNVLVQTVDGQPTPKIIDFGVAKATSQRLTERSLFTELGVLVGTPEYMSPEQADPTTADVDTRTDVYSLGVLLYELLIGVRPFESRELREVAFDEMWRRIREDEPSRPSTRLRTLGDSSRASAACRRTDPRALVRALRGELDWIVMQSLEKDRDRRYGSPAELAAEVGRYLAHEPVLAGPPGAAYRVKKFVRRHRVGVSVASVLGLALVLGVSGTTVGMVRALRAEGQAKLEAENSRAVSSFLKDLFKESDPGESRGEDVTARQLLDRGREKITEELADQPVIQAEMMQTIGDVYASLGLFEESRELMEGALELRREQLGQNHPDLADTLNRLGWVAYQLGDFAECQRLNEEALTILEAVFEPENSRIAETLSDLASVAAKTGEYSTAGALYERALVIWEGSDGPDALSVGLGLNNLGMLQWRRGQYADALRNYERSLAIREKRLEAPHPQLMQSYDNLGNLVADMGDNEASRDYLERALEMAEKLYGPDNVAVAKILHNLGITLDSLGDDETAREYIERALEIRQEQLGPRHPYVGSSLVMLASLDHEAGEHERARERLVLAIDIMEQAHGPEHRRVAQTLAHYAETLAALGEMQAARATAERALRINENTVGAEHPGTLHSMNQLGELRAATGDVDAGIELLQRSLEIREERGDSAEQLRSTLESLAEALERGGREAESAAIRQRLAS
jgi:serine/threonine protein kinase